MSELSVTPYSAVAAHLAEWARQILPTEAVKWLYTNFESHWWRWACATILGT